MLSAVKRNQIKRIARESFRRNARILAGLDVVVISRAGISAADKSALRQTLDADWIRLRDEARLAPMQRSKGS